MNLETALYLPRPQESRKYNLFRFISIFFQRNLFERIIIYIFVSAFLVKLIFELILGQWFFVQSQNQQWIFYALLAIDYITSVRKVASLRVTFNMMSAYAVVVLVMVLQGLFVGIVTGNQPFIILNDTVPLLMIGLNILRFQSLSENKYIDYKFLLTSCTILALATCLIGLLALTLGRPSSISVGSGPIYFPLVLSAIFFLRPFPTWIGFSAFIMLGLSGSELNRTMLAFLTAAFGIYTLALLIKKPAMGISSGIIILMVLTIGWISLPETSGTYIRLKGLMNLDASSKTGSIGERQAEMEAVQAKLDNLGPANQWLGLGFGGVYEVQFTHEYLTNYGHAHYSWVWHNLRFGKIGYIYLTAMVIMLLYNAHINFKRQDPLGAFISLLCIQCLIFCVTYVNSIFLMSGVPFLYTQRAPDTKNVTR